LREGEISTYNALACPSWSLYPAKMGKIVFQGQSQTSNGQTIQGHYRFHFDNL
jgi:hypothetical protein